VRVVELIHRRQHRRIQRISVVVWVTVAVMLMPAVATHASQH
jgi:hypothetical protein